jgi:hypothetical protein
MLEYRFAKPQPQSIAADNKADAGKKMVLPVTQPGSWLDGFAVRVGVRNIFDDAPSFANNVAGYSVPLEDPRQRFVFLDIEKKF